MNHKRGRAKNQRSGCLMCKAWKANGADRRTVAERRQDEADKKDMTGMEFLEEVLSRA